MARIIPLATLLRRSCQLLGGGVTLTYPGTKPIAPSACSFTPGPMGTITIDVPIADVSLDAGVTPLSNRLFSVTASTMTIAAGNAETPAPIKTVTATVGGESGSVNVFNSPIGGQLFDLIDVVRAYDFVPGAGGGGGGGGCHEADGDGHIQGENSGQASFHMDEDPCEDADAEQVDSKDPSGNMDFHSTQILSLAFDDVAHTVTVGGVGLDNGLPVTFTAVGVDNGQTALDTFSLTLSDGYSNIGNLLDGTITLH